MKLFLPAIFIFFSFLLEAQNFGLQFNGTNESVELCDSDQFNIGAGFTIEAWIFASEWKAEAWQGSIVNKDAHPASGFAFRAGKNGTLSFTLGTGAWPEITTEPLMNANQWYHVAVVKEADRLQLFVNGNLSASMNFTGEPLPNDQPITIGDSPGFPGRNWNGLLDEVRIWNVARTQQELADNRAVELSGSEAGLIAYLPMNEGTGQSTINLVDPNCNGDFINLTNAAWKDGFSISRFDVGVTKISAPDVISIFQKPVKLRAEIQNFGSEPISNIPIVVSINGLSDFSETFDITIPAGETASVVFEQIFDLSDNATNLISLSSAHPEDSNSLNDEIAYEYTRPQNENVVNILNKERFNFAGAGQTQFTNINLPEDNGQYESLLLHISMYCPSTGCDPWDQPANIFIDTDQGSYEIARFITPYGKGCGPWTVDVTDFKSLLKGEVTFRSFVQVWGQSGWLVDLDLEYVNGDTQKPLYNKITPLWLSQYWIYGDPNISHDLEEQSITVSENTQDSHIRMTLTGHGQGNTDNAAEFSRRTHRFLANGELLQIHTPWLNNCAQNECSNQAGTWTLSRAGWCPGQSVDPFIVNTSSTFAASQDIKIDYDLADYNNLLNTGYNSGSHTEPHFRIATYFIETSENRFIDYTNLRADHIIINTNGDVSNPAVNSLDFVISNNGITPINNPQVAYYVNNEFIFEESISTTIEAGETHTHSFSQISGFDFTEDNLVFAVVTADGDQNINDDVIMSSIDDQLISTNNLEKIELTLSPNPSTGVVNFQVNSVFLNGVVQVFDILGRTVKQQEINSLSDNLFIKDKGLYILQFTTPKGSVANEKLVIE